MSQHILITVRGHDTPGITRDLTAVLARYDAVLVDVEQVVIHNLLILAFLFEVAPRVDTAGVLEELRQVAHAHELVFESKQLTLEEHKRHRQRHRYVVTLMGANMTAAAMQGVAGVIASAGVNIEKIQRLTEGALTTVELVVSNWSEIEPRQLKGMLLEANERFGIDVAVQRESIFRRSKRLVVMDMDSTLITCEVIDELAAAAGKKEQVSAITERAMRGELDFKASLRERVSTLKGLPADVLAQVAAGISLTPGAETLVSVLHRLGYTTAVISGGFRFFTDGIQKRLDLDYAFANELEIEGGRLTGNVRGRIIDADVKAELLEDIARREGIGLDQVIAIGDGANDLKMLSRAGLGIAFNAKRRVREEADGTITGSLDSILYLLGINQRDIDELTQGTATS